MEISHWLMIGGTFLLAVGLIGSALQKNVQMASGPSSSESDKTTAQHSTHRLILRQQPSYREFELASGS
jgi:hypothetical protein